MCVHLGACHGVCVYERESELREEVGWQVGRSQLSLPAMCVLWNQTQITRLGISPSTWVSFSLLYPKVFQGSTGLRVIQVPLVLISLLSV